MDCKGRWRGEGLGGKGEGLVEVKAKCLEGQFVLSRDLAPKIVSISSLIRSKIDAREEESPMRKPI